jgi:MinD-like ATPase involved in chromosome partitioning or flagellar assembly
MNTKSPLVFAFVSGKGGVGKTMLAVAFAKELSLTNRTLIIDLDFFNRGLTGLMGDGTPTCRISRPDFLAHSTDNVESEWNIVRVAENLFHVSYPDILRDDMQKFETLDVSLLRDSLQRFIHEAAASCDCDCVVLDCHGGPDNSSFAACLIAQYSLLISEPDRITFYGTLNFIRQLKRVSNNEDYDLRLVFNKVVPAFSALFLRSFYNRIVREHFSGKPLLAIFPLEVYLTKEFEKTPFLTAVYPNSWLTKKTRTMLFDLLNAEHRDKLSSPVRSQPRWMRTYRKFSLGKPIPFLNMNFVMPTIVTGVIALVLLNLALSTFYEKEAWQIKRGVASIKVLECLKESPSIASNANIVRQELDNADDRYAMMNIIRNSDKQVSSDDAKKFISCVGHVPYYYSSPEAVLLRSEILNTARADKAPTQYQDEYLRNVEIIRNQPRLYLMLQSAVTYTPTYLLGYLAAVWVGITLLITWSSELEKRFTYYLRLHRFGHGLALFLITVALWFGPILLIAAFGGDAVTEKGRVFGPDRQSLYGAILIIAIVTMSLAALLGDQLLRIYRDARYEGHYVEDLLRGIFLLYVFVGPYVLYQMFMK